MRMFPSGTQIRRAERRHLRRFFAVMAVVMFAFIAIVAVHYLLGWW